MTFMMNILFFCLLSFAFNPFNNVEAKNNLHLIDEDTSSGFAIYRYSKPDKKDVSTLCDLGISEVMVLSGTADKHEFKYQSRCPNLKVVYNEEQSASDPLSASFLSQFDKWVTDAKIQGKKIAFRCECGCHRTGRLAAYYQMKYQDLSTDEAIEVMMDLGKYMWTQPSLKPQVRDLHNFIEGLPCEEKKKYCVKRDEL